MIDRASRVLAVVVTYEPELKTLSELLQSLRTQVTEIVVVDNGSGEQVVSWLRGVEATKNIYLRALGKNTGVAVAFNLGIELARNLQTDFVVFFDHDSLPEPGMIQRLVKATTEKEHEGWKVASVGPRYLDPRQKNPPPFIRVEGLRLKRQRCPSKDSVVEVDYLISSGCLISMKTIDEVGPMRGDFFIDYIDIEWGLRAKALGYQSFGVCGAEMQHSLGDSPIFFMGRSFPNHSPLRHYYHFRNAIHLYRETWVSANWKVVDGWKLVLKFVFYSLFGTPRSGHFAMMVKGIVHGLSGRTGASCWAAYPPQKNCL